MADDPALKPQNRAEEISGEWEHDNQQWWNQYMASADNEIVFTPGPSLELPHVPEHVGPLPKLADLHAELNATYELDPLAIEQFNRDGYVKLKRVLSPGALALLRQEMEATLRADLGENPKLDFRSGEMMWLTNEIFRQFVLSPRIAEIAAALMGVKRVRLYHDNALAKESGCGRTPWHYDAEHFPIASNNVCTAWIPLQAIPQNMGPLAFAVGMQNYRLVESVQSSRFDTSYDRTVSNIFAEQGVGVDDGPFGLGEISFHHAKSFHTAAPNNTTESRMVLATTYFEDGACVIPAPTMISGDWRKFMPDIGAGEPIRSRYNPVCFPSEQ
ncbi:MAG: ectoine hydroxylase-related dioxygenase (phytanoyl-CoA dioxygenase family) [Candidatus Azotimanducaceae bacterium]|jgi:ectoine hydroxylase-related dioxygenase (phytanoyl-CoA dioxygenase family)